jgi:hypothetical protein
MLETLVLAAAVAAAPLSCRASSPEHQVALVELYTSQGCSSCPPADRWLSAISSREGGRVVPIALHVGYWDYIGWKDPYAQPAFNDRQRALAAANASRSVYTPGVFVQGREFARWSDAAGFDRAVEAINRTAAPVAITLEARVAAAGIVVDARASAPSSSALRDPRLHLALVQSGLSTAVGAGENRGATLRNDRVVRQWSGPMALAPSPVHWALPPDTPVQRLSLVAFVQESGAEGRVLQAMQVPLGDCERSTR